MQLLNIISPNVIIKIVNKTTIIVKTLIMLLLYTASLLPASHFLGTQAFPFSQSSILVACS